MAHMHNPAHPGEVLREFLPEEMSIGEVAVRLGVSRPHLSRLLNGHTSMTAEMAIKVGMLTGTTPESWLVNQAKWDLWQASQKPLPKVEPLDLKSAARRSQT
jgi:addiction module HigA family antidote